MEYGNTIRFDRVVLTKARWHAHSDRIGQAEGTTPYAYTVECVRTYGPCRRDLYVLKAHHGRTLARASVVATLSFLAFCDILRHQLY